jgi:hypothetical protein
MLRRLLLVGVFVLIQRGSITQLVVGSTFCAVYLLLQMQIHPYLDHSSNFIANSCSFMLLVIFLICIVYGQGERRPSPRLMQGVRRAASLTGPCMT